MAIEITPYGQRALLINWPQRISAALNGEVHQMAELICRWAGVEGCTPAYCTLLVRFHPRQRQLHELSAAIHQAYRELGSTVPRPSREVAIPVDYSMAAAPDMAEVMRLTGLAHREVVALHTEQTYQVFMLGFLPGFPYLGPLPSALHCPRKAIPRQSVPPLSVAIAGGQTGIYPVSAPGGWQLIGKAQLPVFDPAADPPFLLKPGDRVKFKAV
ncbi:5-oxoprolinase subunit PxpB [Phaeodactylibacter luteus]|uniref:5-oxoprolinase subunit PxpB n=1 Tax=Phaeodactylibacter luteus TaxID=1564516 RepID=A0A5C6RL15_9BACT|nr:5-oxoprolinase subunit PxpB [Phaeodactylibacter luteus]TXB62927.1 5-oxoprolinase subunit PxpB [Phaeodactylibacter luteus]